MTSDSELKRFVSVTNCSEQCEINHTPSDNPVYFAELMLLRHIVSGRLVIVKS